MTRPQSARPEAPSPAPGRAPASLPLRGGQHPRSGGTRREGTDWRDHALCTQVDPNLFFPTDGGVPYLAKQVCMRCPVRTDCFDFAMSTPVHGVWGGTTLPEREGRAKAQGERYRTAGHSDRHVHELRVAELHARGLLDTEIAADTGLCKDTVGRIRKRLGLPCNVRPTVMPAYVLAGDRRRKQARKARGRQEGS